jgi:two-component system, OmpR family, sensor histidine kinase SenX3
VTWLVVGLVIGIAVTVSASFVIARRANGRRIVEDRRRDEQLAALEDTAERLERALDAIPQGVAICDGAGTLLFHNSTGAHYSSARHGDALVEAAIEDLLMRAVVGEACVETVELFGPPRRTLVITAVPLHSDRIGAGAVAIIDDVTERRHLEAVRRDFVANISHELKTPVGALALLAETLLDETDPAVGQRLAGRILTESHRVARTIEDLLELSSIEAEDRHVREPVPVHEILSAAVARIGPAADQRSIAIDVKDIAEDVAVSGDRRQLVSALFNLLENAVKYSADGSAVAVRAEASDSHVDLVVEDHGIGIPTRDLERVFERFYRVDQARSRETGGTGLGLAIVRHVVNNHAGEVDVASREGEGSTFTLRFPTQQAATDPQGTIGQGER